MDKHTHTHHITIWLPDLPVGPEQPNQSSAGRTAMTMQNGWTQRKGRVEGGMKTSVRTCAFATVTFVHSEREKMAFL